MLGYLFFIGWFELREMLEEPHPKTAPLLGFLVALCAVHAREGGREGGRGG